MAKKKTTIQAVTKTAQKNLSLSPQCAFLLKELARRQVTSQAQVVERLVREEAKRTGLLRTDIHVDPTIDDLKYLRPGGPIPPGHDDPAG